MATHQAIGLSIVESGRMREGSGRRTGADELMVVSDVFDPALRRRSFGIIADVRP